MKIAVIGAGAFGSWTAFHLQSKGHDVTLYDRHGSGNPKSSSGGESRMIRGIYGNNQQYIEWTTRSLELWKSYQLEWEEELFVKTGILWMFSQADDFARNSLTFLEQVNWTVDELTKNETKNRFSQINVSDIHTLFYEPDAGFLRANHACKVVTDQFQKLGGIYIEKSINRPVEPSCIETEDGTQIEADHYIFACGPWMKNLFPEKLGNKINPTRQEVFFFDTPQQFQMDSMPMWADFGDVFHYGIPGSKYHGFKIANDTRGESFDPETGNREPSEKGRKKAMDYATYRFPELAGRKITDARVCQYEDTPDEHFIIDRNPDADNIWLVCGGSGHGFKMGPAIGEAVAQMVTGQNPINPFFALSRFDS